MNKAILYLFFVVYIMLFFRNSVVNTKFIFYHLRFFYNFHTKLSF